MTRLNIFEKFFVLIRNILVLAKVQYLHTINVRRMSICLQFFFPKNYQYKMSSFIPVIIQAVEFVCTKQDEIELNQVSFNKVFIVLFNNLFYLTIINQTFNKFLFCFIFIQEVRENEVVTYSYYLAFPGIGTGMKDFGSNGYLPPLNEPMSDFWLKYVVEETKKMQIRK